jgi:hypothetical protein
MTGHRLQAARLWARVVALAVDWTAALAPTAALAGSALGGLVDQVWAPLREGAYLVAWTGLGRPAGPAAPGSGRAASGPAMGRTPGRELGVLTRAPTVLGEPTWRGGWRRGHPAPLESC